MGFLQRIRIIKIIQLFFIPLNITARDLRIDFFHRLVVFPPADLHCNALGHFQVIRQAGEAVPQAVYADLSNPVISTDSLAIPA